MFEAPRRPPSATRRPAPGADAADFERRFRAMEAQAGDAFAGLSLEEQEDLWVAVKSAE